MAIKRFVALNFFPLDNQEIDFSIYRQIRNQNGKIGFNTDISQRRLPTVEYTQEKYEPYLVSFNPREGYEKFCCNLYTNIHLSNNWLYTILLEKYNNELGGDSLLPIRSNFWEDLIVLKNDRIHYTCLIAVEQIIRTEVSSIEKWHEDFWLLDAEKNQKK